MSPIAGLNGEDFCINLLGLVRDVLANRLSLSLSLSPLPDSLVLVIPRVGDFFFWGGRNSDSLGEAAFCA